MNTTHNGKVLAIYTGGTIGSMPRDPNDPDSPQIVVPWAKFKELSPFLAADKLGFEVEALETSPLDSCNIGPKEWKEMALAIKSRYDEFEGFVIIHGTDTMVNTASALSFMLENLNKPVILTGAQMSYLASVRNDGMQNLITALMLANPRYMKIPVIPEVCIYFGGKVFRGNRTRKVNANGFDAYHSPNFPLLAEVGESIKVNERILLKRAPEKALTVNTRLEPDVAAVVMYPGVQDGNVLDAVFKNPKLKGVVLMAYGAGNIPTKPKKVLDMVREARARNVVILDVTQCGGGKVELGLYETSALLLDARISSGVDITPEAALAKLMVVLGDEDLSVVEKAARIERNLAGEVSLGIHTTVFANSDDVRIDSSNPRARVAAADLVAGDTAPDRIQSAVLRLRSGKVTGKGETPVEVKVFMNLGSDEQPDEKSPNYLGSFKRRPNPEPTVLFLDVTEAYRRVTTKRASFTVMLAGDEGSVEWKGAEFVIFTNE